MTRPAPLRVLLSFPPPQGVYNPYTVMLTEAIAAQPGVEVFNFSWKRALRGGYDVFHVHWPENLVTGHGPVKEAGRQGLCLAFLIRLRARGVPIVRTVHNVERPAGLSRRQQALLDLVDRQTALRIVLNDHTPVPDATPVEVIPHGHYRTWFAGYPASLPQTGQVAYFGRIRRYKGVERLITAFHEVDEARTGPVRLWIGGLPSSPELVDELRALSAGDARIELRPGFQSDAAVVDAVTRSELVVLPYLAMHNSGAALAALSLARPVLVPDNEVNRALAVEVGGHWVQTFEGELDGEALTRALLAARRTRGAPPADLTRREWPHAGARHVAAYRRALGQRAPA